MKKLFALLLIVKTADAASCRVLNFSDLQGVTTRVLALSEGSSRACLSVQNKGAASLLIQVSTSQGASEGISVAANGVWEPANPPTNAIYVRAVSGATTSVYVHDGIK